MTWQRLSVFSAVGLAMWALIISAISFTAKQFASPDVWYWSMIVVWCLIVALLIRWLWKAVDREEARMEYEAMIRESEALNDYGDDAA